MQYKKTLATAALAATALSAYAPPEPWSTLTPPGTYPGGTTNYPSTFGIAVQTAAAGMGKRDAISQIDDGQIQAPRREAVSQIGDGQIQATRVGEDAPKYTEIPYTTERPETLMPAVSQIRDGQIQNTDHEVPKVTEIPYTTERKVPIVPAVSQIHDGQIQAPVTTEERRTVPAVSQIHDGQIQNTRVVPAATQIHDGQVQATKAPAEKNDMPAAPKDDASVSAVSCKVPGTLQLHLEDGILYDERGRIGSIVANHQFQFDGPPPQAGAIYAKGWSITPTGFLALGDSDLFYQCLSGDFYNLYDESIGGQCHPVHLEVVDLVDC